MTTRRVSDGILGPVVVPDPTGDTHAMHRAAVRDETGTGVRSTATGTLTAGGAEETLLAVTLTDLTTSEVEVRVRASDAGGHSCDVSYDCVYSRVGATVTERQNNPGRFNVLSVPAWAPHVAVSGTAVQVHMTPDTARDVTYEAEMWVRSKAVVTPESVPEQVYLLAWCDAAESDWVTELPAGYVENLASQTGSFYFHPGSAEQRPAIAIGIMTFGASSHFPGSQIMFWGRSAWSLELVGSFPASGYIYTGDGIALYIAGGLLYCFTDTSNHYFRCAFASTARHHVGLVWTGTAGVIYVDGVAQETTQNGPVNPAHTNGLGAFYGNTMTLERVAIWSVALEAADFVALNSWTGPI